MGKDVSLQQVRASLNPAEAATRSVEKERQAEWTRVVALLSATQKAKVKGIPDLK